MLSDLLPILSAIPAPQPKREFKGVAGGGIDGDY